QVSLNYFFQISKGAWPLRRSRKLSQIQSPDAGLQCGHDGLEGPRRCQAESFDLYSSYRHTTFAGAPILSLQKCCARSATRSRLLVEGCVFEKVGERRRRKALDVPNSDIAQYVIERGRRLPADDAAQAIPELPLHCQPW